MPGSGDWCRATIGKVESGGQVSGDGGRHGVMFYSFSRDGTETPLDEADQRCMVKDLRIDPSTLLQGEMTSIGTRMPRP